LDPSQESLIRAFSISRQWSVEGLFKYAYDHFRRQFEKGNIHPAVVLGVAREYGIPDLIAPAVKALAKPEIPLASWSTDPDIIRYTTVMDIGTIGRMKEKLIMARFALCTPPRISHDEVICQPTNHPTCSTSWKLFWTSRIVPRLLNYTGETDNQLWWIKTDRIAKAEVPGMTPACAERTIQEVIAGAAWRVEMRIPEGAVEALMVEECGMLAPGDVPDVMIS
jgi:hypothetical protein